MSGLQQGFQLAGLVMSLELTATYPHVALGKLMDPSGVSVSLTCKVAAVVKIRSEQYLSQEGGTCNSQARAVLSESLLLKNIDAETLG